MFLVLTILNGLVVMDFGFEVLLQNAVLTSFSITFIYRMLICHTPKLYKNKKASGH